MNNGKGRMTNLEDFQKHCQNDDFQRFLKLWKEVCFLENIDSEEFIELLNFILNSKFANRMGEYVELAIPLWRDVDDTKDSYHIIRSLVDLQTTSSSLMADIAYTTLLKKYGEDPNFEEKIDRVGLKERKNFQGAISKFELLTHLERGNLVFQKKGWGNGEVRRVSHTKEEVDIEFENDAGIKTLSFDTALTSLLPVYYNSKSINLHSADSTDSSESKEKGSDESVSALKNLLKNLRKKTSPQKKNETPLTKAIIYNDINKVIQLKDIKDQAQAKNFLDFNAIELARYLDREECLEILEPEEKKIFKVKPKGSSEVVQFTLEEFQEFFGIHFIKHLKFGNYQLFQDVIKSHGYSTWTKHKLAENMSPEVLEKYEGTREQNILAGLLYAEKIQNAYTIPLTIKWIDDIIEYGAFTDIDLKKGEYVGEYIGEIRPYLLWSKQNDYSIIYPNHSMKKYRVDPEVEGNELRFTNHSFQPNIHCIPAFDRGLIHSCFFALEDIPKGTQLCWNYGKEFWVNRASPRDI